MDSLDFEEDEMDDELEVAEDSEEGSPTGAGGEEAGEEVGRCDQSARSLLDAAVLGSGVDIVYCVPK